MLFGTQRRLLSRLFISDPNLPLVASSEREIQSNIGKLHSRHVYDKSTNLEIQDCKICIFRIYPFQKQSRARPGQFERTDGQFCFLTMWQGNSPRFLHLSRNSNSVFDFKIIIPKSSLPPLFVPTLSSVLPEVSCTYSNFKKGWLVKSVTPDQSKHDGSCNFCELPRFVISFNYQVCDLLVLCASCTGQWRVHNAI